MHGNIAPCNAAPRQVQNKSPSGKLLLFLLPTKNEIFLTPIFQMCLLEKDYVNIIETLKYNINALTLHKKN